MHFTPAEYVIIKFGGIRKTARLLNRAPSSVYGWKLPRLTRGEAGDIPVAVRHKILKIAKQKRLDITLEDLQYGRTIVS